MRRKFIDCDVQAIEDERVGHGLPADSQCWNYRTPIGTLHWYLVNFQPSRRRAIMVANVIYLLMYGVCRVYIVRWILQILGSQTGHSAWEAFVRLRTSCQLGTATIGVANSVWLILGIRNFVRRYLSSAMVKKGT